MKPAILYISYDGMLEPLGQSQVLAYLERLAPDYRIILISFEKPADWADAGRREALRRRIAAAGIDWKPRRYHKAPSAPATAYDVAVGSAAAIALALRHRVAIVHARSYVAALMALQVKRLTGAKFLFDMRGFWADERVDGGIWPAGGRLYRLAKRLEAKFLRAADHVVTLTHASAAEMKRFPYLQGRMPPIDVIPTCTDLDRFAPRGGPAKSPFVLGHVGSLGTWYLLDELLASFRILVELAPDARLLIVNRDEHRLIRDAVARMGIDRERVEIVSADPGEVPAAIARMSAGCAIIKPVYSKTASAPTKLGEYLGCGIPCLGNAGVGDMADILEGERVGVALRDFGPEALRADLRRLLDLAADAETPKRCVEVAHRLFSLDKGAEAYRGIYRGLIGAPRTPGARG